MADTVNSYQDLLVWQHEMDLAQECYGITANFPKAEQFGLVSQIRRAAVSIPANVAEGYGREGAGEFIQVLRIAQGSLKELETHCILSERLRFVSPERTRPVLVHAESLRKMLCALIRRLVEKKAGARKPTTPHPRA